MIRGEEDEEYESEDEKLPDYIDASGNCKYCGAKYTKKKHKGGKRLQHYLANFQFGVTTKLGRLPNIRSMKNYFGDSNKLVGSEQKIS